MNEIKYIEFTTLGELEEKVAKLKVIRDENMKVIEEFLLANEIPFTRLADGFGVDLEKVPNDKITAYFNEFKSNRFSTRAKYTENGVVFLPVTGNTVTDHAEVYIDLQKRVN